MELIGFDEYLREADKAENTIASYHRAIENYLIWYRESYGMELKRLYRTNIVDHIAYLRTVQQLNNRSVNVHLAALICFNEYLCAIGAQTERVVSRKDYLKVQTQYANPSNLSKAEVEEFRQRVLIGQGKRDHAIVTLLAYSGLRISEALNLELRDVDLSNREIMVRCGKGDKQRLVIINDKIVNALREYLPERDSEQPWLFISRKGGRLDRSRVNKLFNKYSQHITPHSLRHFYCSQALEAGFSIADVAAQAGHSNVQTTLIYTNPSRELLKERANRL